MKWRFVFAIAIYVEACIVVAKQPWKSALKIHDVQSGCRAQFLDKTWTKNWKEKNELNWRKLLSNIIVILGS